jgi:hypothetical protein
MPTPEEVAKLLGIPRKDVKPLEALVAELISNRQETIGKFGSLSRPASGATGKKPAAKRGSRENPHR